MNTEKLEFNPYKILEVKGRKYLYMIENSGIFEIDPSLDFFLSMDNAENIPCTSDSVSLSVKEQAQFIKDMKAADIVKNNDSTRSINPVEDPSDINLNGITLMVSVLEIR